MLMCLKQFGIEIWNILDTTDFWVFFEGNKSRNIGPWRPNKSTILSSQEIPSSPVAGTGP